MKKLSSFKDSKVDLKNVKGGGMFSYGEIMWGPPGTPNNYLHSIYTDLDGAMTWTEVHLNR